MKILHLLSQLELTGAEAYAIWLAERQINDGHDVFIVSDRIHMPTRAVFKSQPIAKRNLISRIKNTFFLHHFLRENKIDVIHAHSRAASWVAYATGYLSSRPVIVSTVHGRQHLHKNWRKRDVYGDRVIAICENIYTHLCQEMGMACEKINVIRNGIDFSKLADFKLEQNESQPNKTTKTRNLTFIGRSSGPKGQRLFDIIQYVFPSLLKEFPELKIKIAGGHLSNFPSAVLEQIQNLNRKYPDSIQLDGVMSLPSFYQAVLASNVVVGSGRVAITSLGLGIPTMAVGEACSLGLVTSLNLSECLSSNFGDIWQSKTNPDVDYEKIRCELSTILKKIPLNEADIELPQNAVHKEFCGKKNAEYIQQVYLAALAERAHPRHIPVLMYHKVTSTPLNTKHKIFVTKERFEEHMCTLKESGFSSITFKDYEAFRSGKRPWDQFPKKPIFLTFDDAYVDNLTNAFPIMRKYGQKATIFALGDPSLQSNRWDTDNDPSEPSSPLMSDVQLKELLAAGFEVGAHSLSHRDLTTLSSSDSLNEIHASKKNLEERLGTEIISFAYPYGKYNNELKAQVRAVDYKFAVATDTGGLHLEQDPYAIFRASVFPTDEGSRIKRKSAPWYRRYYRFKRGK